MIKKGWHSTYVLCACSFFNPQTISEGGHQKTGYSVKPGGEEKPLVSCYCTNLHREDKWLTGRFS